MEMHWTTKSMSSPHPNCEPESADTVSKAAQKLVGERYRKDKIPILRFFLAHYSSFPCVSLLLDTKSKDLFHVTSALAHLIDEFGHDLTKDIIHRKYNRRAKEYVVR